MIPWYELASDLTQRMHMRHILTADVLINTENKDKGYIYLLLAEFASVARNKIQLPRITVPTTVKVI